MDDLGAERVNLAHCIGEAPGGVVQMWLLWVGGVQSSSSRGGWTGARD